MVKPEQKSKEKAHVLLEATRAGGVGKGAGGQWEHTQTQVKKTPRQASSLPYQPLHPDRKRDHRQDRTVLSRASRECGEDEGEVGRKNKGFLIVIICGFLLSTLSLCASSWGH